MVRASTPPRPALAGLAVAVLFALGLCGKAFCKVARASGGRPGLRAHRAAAASAPNGGNAGTAAVLRHGAVGLVALGAATAAFGGTGISRRWGQKQTGTQKTLMQYTTKKVMPKMEWLKGGLSGGDLAPGDLRTLLLGGCDICVGRTQSGKLFAVGDKAPPTGISFSAGGEIQGEKIVEPQYGNVFDVNTGLPEGSWCPSPILLGAVIGAFMGGPQAVATFQVREGAGGFFGGGGGQIEILVDTNAKDAYEADYWKGVLDAQGKDDGTYY